MCKSTGIAKLLSPDFKILLCSSFVFVFQSFFFCKDQSTCVYLARLNWIFKYQQGIGGCLIKTGDRISRVPVANFDFYKIF